MSNVNKKIISLAVYVVLLLALVVGIVVFVVGAIKNPLTDDPDTGDDTAPEGEIIISEEIHLYREQEMHLAPYIMSDDGTVATSAFVFAVDREDIVTVDDVGIVKAVGEGEAIITINDKRTSLEKDVKVTVSSALVAVLDIKAGTAGKLGSIGTQEYTYGQEYILTVNTLPSGCDVSKLCKVTVNGDKEAFEVVYDKNEIKIIPIAIGYGILDVTVDGYYEGSLEFNLNFKNKSISDSIKETSNGKIMTVSDFDSVKTLTIDGAKGVDELELFKKLDTLYIRDGSANSLKTIFSKTKYYVPESSYLSCYNSNTWQNQGNWKRLYPYNTSDKNVKYIVYHNTATGEVSTDAIDYSFNLMIPQNYNGKTFDRWIDENGRTITAEVAKNSSESIHVYSEWSAITYNVVYHVHEWSDRDITVTEVHSYDEEFKLKDITTFSGYRDTGKVFVGWTTVANGTDAVYEPDKQVKNLASTQGATINLYAVWKIIEYTIVYEIPTGLPAEIKAPASKTTTRGDELKLAKVDIPVQGYVFNGWKDSSGKLYPADTPIEHLTKEDGAEIKLTADIEGIVSNYLISLGGGVLVDAKGETHAVDFLVELKYGEKYTFTAPTHPAGKTFKGWSYDGKVYQSGDVITNTSTENGMFIIKALWE